MPRGRPSARLLLTLLLLPGCSAGTRAGLNPETGSYLLQPYPARVYGASPQNWGIAQDDRGVMFFANTEGLLEFDGVSWRVIPLASRIPAVRSVSPGERGVVFVGGVGEFGYFRPDAAGTLKYVSLIDRVPQSDRQFADVWRILRTPQGVYFSSYARIFRLNHDETVSVLRPATRFGVAFWALGSLFARTPELGLMRLDGDTFSAVPGGKALADDDPIAVLPRPGVTLIASSRGHLHTLSGAGLAPLKSGADSWLQDKAVYCIHEFADGEIAIGTRKGGLVFMDPDDGGRIDRILSKATGLPDDFVTAIFEDRQGGVWLTGGNGIARLSRGISEFGERHGLHGDTQSLARQDRSVYVGTTTGLFRLSPAQGTEPRFERVDGISDRVWTLTPAGSGLLAATDRGLFQVFNSSARPVSALDGVVLDVSLSIRDPDWAYAVGRGVACKLHKEGGSWVRAGAIVPTGQDFQSVLEDNDGRVWATTRGGIWRIDFREEPARVEKFGSAQGVPANWINARRLNGHIVFATEKGLKRYSVQEKRFAPDVTLGDEFADGRRNVYNTFEDGTGNVWVTGPNYHDLLGRSASGYTAKAMPLLRSGIREIYWMWTDGDGIVWAVGDERKLFRWDPSLAGNPDSGFQALTRRVQVHGSKAPLFGGSGTLTALRLPYASNNLRFEFAAPFYEEPAAVEYQVKLEGHDADWPAWSHETLRDYTDLSEGSYRFHVRARTPHGIVSEQSNMAFGVAPPWYRTWWAYCFYLALLGVGVWALVGWRTRQLEADKRRLEGIVEERTVEIRQQRDEIQVQERKTHSLLLNILPAAVADELKTTGAVKPVGFDEVTVCFTDFVGFTLSSEKMQPGRLVDALNEYFTAFDEIMARYGLEKLKTIGDSYMFASGLPVRRASHAVDAVLAALEMADVVRTLAAKEGGTGWNIRIGLHSGPVVAGVVGIRKFAFDIWGNTVNFAARMESSGVHGRVNMSERTHHLLRGCIDCESRGNVKIKEGRELPMYLALEPAGTPEAFARRYREEFGEDLRSFSEKSRAAALSFI